MPGGFDHSYSWSGSFAGAAFAGGVSRSFGWTNQFGGLSRAGTLAGTHSWTSSFGGRVTAKAGGISSTHSWNAVFGGAIGNDGGFVAPISWKGTFGGPFRPYIYFPVEEDRFRFIVEEAHSGEILSRDLIVQEPKIMRALSGPCVINFKVNPKDTSAVGIYFRPWAQWIHVEKVIRGERKIWASGIVQPSEVDKKSGIIDLQAKGFADYPKGIPWLENWNPLAVDAFEIVHKIWEHLQSYENGDLGIVVYPAESGIIMLPGYAFDGQIMNTNFFSEFIRATDKQDCGDHLNKLARDIPFDYVEQSAWNANRTGIDKKLFLGYPKAGYQQDNLSFVLNENVIEAKPHTETEIDWASDSIVDGWWPGTEYSNHFTNADPNRFRRVIYQDDARINSNERAHVWARRRLTRRQTPAYWDSIIVDMGHPNAPFGSYDVGDRIMVKGQMPTLGDVNQLHKIIAIGVDEKQGTCELTLKAEGAFNYDPIYYQGDVAGSITISGGTAPKVVVTSPPGTVGIS